LRDVARRSRADWPVVLGAWLLLLCATTVLATGALYADVVAVGGLRRAVDQARPADRNALVWTTVGDDFDRVDAAVSGALASVVVPNGGEISRVVRDSWLAPNGVGDTGQTVSGLAGHERLSQHADLVTGRWPEPGRDPIEASVPLALAAALGLEAGDRVRMADQRDPDRTVDLVVTATWQPIADDPYWQSVGGDEAAEAAAGRSPVVVTLQDARLVNKGRPLAVEWRVLPSADGLVLDGVADLRRELETLHARIASADRGRTFTIRSTLPALLAETERAVLVSRGGVLLLVGQFTILAAYAITLVAGILLDRRRAGNGLLEARGAGTSQIGALALGEALLLAIPTIVVAPVLGFAIVQAMGQTGPLAASGIAASVSIGGTPLVASFVAAGAGVIALTIPAMLPGSAPSRIRATFARQGSQTLAQRLGFDLALVVLAAIGLWQMRLYGAPISRDVRGTLGIDPLLIAAPAIGLLAGGVLAVRVLPLLADAAQALLVRRPGLVLPLGARQVARRPLRYTRSALLVMLAVSLGTFSAVYAATWSRSQADQAAYLAASDVRVIGGDDTRLPAWASGAAYRAVPGVERVTGVIREPIDVGRSLRGGELVGIDPDVASAMSTLGPVSSSGSWPDLAAALRVARPATGAPLPVGVRRLALMLDTAMTAPPDAAAPVPGATRTIRAAALVLDSDGRIVRLEGGDAAIAAVGQRIEVDIPASVGGSTVDLGELRLFGVEVIAGAPGTSTLVGSIDLRAVETSLDEAGTDWTTIMEPGAAGWSWASIVGSQLSPYLPSEGRPGRLDIGGPTLVPIGGARGATSTFRFWLAADVPEALPAIAGTAFAAAAGVAIGDRLNATVSGQTITVDIVGTVETLSPLDPTKQFIVVDAATLEMGRFAATGLPIRTDEWWLAVANDRTAAVLDQLRAQPFRTDMILAREELALSASTDPLGLGVVGALILGALAAIVVGAIGFVVSATVSTSERFDEFAILQALGLSSRQLSAWVTLENAFLLLLGMVSGLGIGLLLAWLVVPFASLTRSGAAPVPEPELVVPWFQLAPLYALSGLLLVATVVVVRRQLAGARMGDVLRGRGL
jgi:hypothetical protein